MAHIERKISSEHIFTGQILSLERDTVVLENGAVATREIVRHNGGVTVLPIDDEGNCYLVSQYRHPYGREILEAPAGKLGISEDPFECGKRELLEETGFKAERYTDLGRLLPSPGYCAEVLYLYLAQDLSFCGQHLDEDEFLSVIKMPIKRAVELVLSGEIEDAKTQVVILKANAILGV